MSYEINALRYVGLYTEPAGSYAVDNSGTPGDFLALPFKEGTWAPTLGQDMLDPMHAKVRIDGHSERVLGKKSVGLNFTVPLHSHGVALAGTGTVPTVSTWALFRLLKAVLGGSVSTTSPGSGTTVQAGTTTTTVNVTTGHGARFTAGGVIGCIVSSGATTIEAREILSISTDAITVKEAFSANPVSSSAVYGGITLYPTEDPDTSLQFLAEGREISDRLCLRGLQGGISIAMPLGGIPEVSFKLAGATWSILSDGSGITVPSFANFSPFASVDAQVHLPTVGTTTRTPVHASEWTIEPGFSFAPITSGSGTETILRMRKQSVRPAVKSSVVIPYEDSTWHTAQSSKTDLAHFVQLGSTPGSVCLISLPTVQVTDVQRQASGGQVSGQKVTMEGRHDSSALASTTEITYAPFRMHFL